MRTTGNTGAGFQLATLLRRPWSEGLVALLLFSAASVLYMHHRQQTYSEPEATVTELLAAIQAADLPRFRDACQPDYYDQFIRYFGTQKLQRVESVYNRVWDQGFPEWDRRRSSAERAAGERYDALRVLVDRLGREAVRNLSVEERMDLIDNPDDYERFVYTAGVRALPPDEQKRIPDVEEFRHQRDRQAFRVAIDNAWDFAPADDKVFLGSREALRRNSPQMVAFVDRVGVSRLRGADAAEIQGIARAEKDQPDAFIVKYGQIIAGEFLAKVRTTATGPLKSCRFTMQTNAGSLLRGPEATCVVQVSGRSDTSELLIILRKARYEWLVSSIGIGILGSEQWFAVDGW